MKLHNPKLFSILCLAVLATTACGKSAENAAPDPADGPVTIVLPDDIDGLLAAGDPKKGEELFATKGCKACHNLTEVKLVGPGLTGVGKRRSAKWMARMILRPEVMVKEDPTAKELLGKYMVAMANQNVSPDKEMPHLVAYLRAQ